MEQTFYVYAFLRKNLTPYYVGKGHGKRAFSKRPRGQVQPPKDKTRVVLLSVNLSESEAFRRERHLIFVLGRKDIGTGILLNRTDGGEGTKGIVFSEEHRQRLVEARRQRAPMSEVTRRKIAEACRRATESEEVRRKMAERSRGRIHSEEARQRIAESKRGKPCSEKTRQKIAEKRRGFVCSEEHRQRMVKTRLGRKWWVNEHGETRFSREAPGPEWKLGRKW